MSSAGQDLALAHEWIAAASRPEIAGALEDVYEDTARRVAERGPACWASGRCCNFAKTGHLLYVTGLEAAYTMTRLAAPPTPLRVCQARDAGGCPFQVGNLCGVHPIRPLGCRVYFCDRTAQTWQQELYELELAGVRALHQEHAVSYRYQEWRDLLELLATACMQKTNDP